VSALARIAAAQELTGTVRDSASGTPIAGAVLTLRDSSGAALERRLTTERGEYRIPLGNAGSSMRVVRLGFEPRDLRIPARANGSARLDFRLLALPSMLRPVRVIANSHCPVRADAASAMGLWEQARAGLLATVVARQQNPASMLRLISQQVLDGTSDRIRSMRVRADSSVDTISFVAARTAQDFVRFGFRHDSAERRITFGPDAVVLLSDEFAAAYCFQLASGGRARPREVGIRFLPALLQRDRTDIDGTLWIDTTARELRDVEYVYLGVQSRMEAFRPGGHVSFRAMPNGEVLVDRWSIRSVGVTYDTVWSTTGPGGFIGRGRGGTGLGDPSGSTVAQRALRDRLYATVTGGELARASWPDGLVWQALLGTLRARVLKSDGIPASGSLLSLVGTPYFGIADSTGLVELRDLVPGPYEVRTVVDPRLAQLGLGTATPVTFTASRDSAISATVTVPTAESVAAERCAQPRSSSAADSVRVLGRVMKPDGTPIADARVTFAARASEGPQWRAERSVTRADGFFVSCHGWNVGEGIVVRVSRGGVPPIDLNMRFASPLLVVPVIIEP
jgi:hypothetical protein